MNQKGVFVRIVASFLILTFSYSQFVWAADPRQMLLDAKAYFEEENSKRPRGMSPAAYERAEADQQSAVNQQQMLEDFQNTTFNLTTPNGDILKYVGDKLSAVNRPDGTKLSGIITDANGNIVNADLGLADGSVQIFRNGEVIGYMTPDGSQVIYQGGVIQKVISRSGLETIYTYIRDTQGAVTETILDSPSHVTKYDANQKIKEATRKSDNQKIFYVNGIIDRILNTDGSQVLFSRQTVNGDIVVTPQGGAANLFIDSYGNKYHFQNGAVSQIELPDGGVLDSITWAADDTVKDANLTEADGSRYIYQDKKLMRFFDLTAVVTNFTYTPTTITATKAGAVYEYLSDGTAVKFTSLAGDVTTYIQSGIYKGLKEREVLSTGVGYLYEYQGSGTAITALRREVQSTIYNTTTFEGQSNLSQSTNPKLTIIATIPNDGSIDQAVTASATFSTTKNLSVKLIAGTGSTYTFNGVTTSLGVTLNKGTTYRLDLRWETGRVGIYVYNAASALPSTPTKSITDRAWDPKFKVTSTNAAIALVAGSSGYYNQNFSARDKNYAILSGSPVFQMDFKQLAAGYKTISLKATQSQSGNIRRTITLSNDSAGKWTFTTSDFNTTNSTTTTTSSTLTQPLQANRDYILDLRIEGTKLNLYVYDKGAQRPLTPIAAINAFAVGTSFELYSVNGLGQSMMLKNMTAPAFATTQATALTPRVNTLTASTVRKPAGGASTATGDFQSIRYDAASNLKEVLLNDGVRLVFAQGILSQAYSASGALTTFDFEQSGLSNLVGSTIAQSNLTSKYDAEGQLSSVQVGEITVHYADGGLLDYVEKADGTEIYGMAFDASGNLTDAVIYAPDGEERTYVAGKLAELRRPDQSRLFYVNNQLTKMITAEALTYDFNYNNPSIIQAVLAGPAPTDALTPIRMEYDSNFNLKKVVRQNQEAINYLNNAVDRIDAPNEAPKVFSYQRDAAGNILSYAVTQGNIVTNYDANNQPVSAVISPDASNPNTLNIAYQYGKIRQVKKNGMVTFNYSYSFNSAGKEQTVVSDLEENTTKIYEEELMRSSLDNDTSVLSSYEYQDGRVSEVEVSRFGRVLHTYDYEYSAADVIVTDESGVVRTYDANNRLTFLEKNGEKFAYTYTMQTITTPNGPPVVQETALPNTLYQTSARSVLPWNGAQAWFSYEQPYGNHYLQTHWAGQWVEYTVNTSQAGDLKISLQGMDSNSLPAGYTNFQLEFMVDGVSKGTMSVPASSSAWQDGLITLTGIAQGSHTVRFNFTNFVSAGGAQTDFKFRNITFKQVVTTQPTTTSQELITEESMIKKRLSDGSIAHYLNGKVTQIDRPSGSSLKQLVLNAEGGVAEARLYANAQDTTGTKVSFQDGQISQVHLPGGQVLIYAYDRDANGNIVNTWVKKGAANLKYDAQQNLQGLKISSVLDPGEVQAATNHAYQGGLGALSIDGNFSTAQAGSASGSDGGAAVDMISSHTFPQPQTISEITFRVSVSSSAYGSYERHHETAYRVEYMRNGAWFVAPGSVGGGGCCEGSTSIDSGVVRLQNLNITDAQAIRAYTHAYGNVTGGGSSYSASSAIYEIQYVLADLANMALTRTLGAGGQVTAYTLTGAKGSIGFSAAGSVTLSDPDYAAVQQELTGVIQNYAVNPYKNEDFSTLHAVFADTETVVSQEYSENGTLETQTKADGTVTLFENNKPSKVLDSTGRILIQYTYDAAGNPTRVYLKNARDTLPDEVLKAKQSIESQRADALRQLAAQRNLAYQSIQTQYQAQRAALESQIAGLESQYNSVSNTSAKGKAAKSARGDVLNQIGEAIQNTRIALTTSYNNEADSYAGLDSQVMALSNQIDADSARAVTDLGVQETQMKREILRQEVSPIVYDYYRRILGRDPDTAEYNYWIGLIDYNSGATLTEAKTTAGVNFTTALNSYITALPELGQRQTYVNAIKASVTAAVNSYAAMTQPQKEAYAATLGLASSDLIPLSQADATKILNWINTRSLHFGQSAFLALESLLDQRGTTYNREDLAKKAILTDILTGVISPLDDGDLVISVFSLNKVAQSYGLALKGANLAWDDLRSVYQSNPTARVIAHVRDNHFVIVTGMTADSITYIDPGKGKDKQNEIVTLAKTEFLKGWKGNVALEQAKLAAVANYESKTLTAEQTKNIRGAFFFFFIPAILGALSSIGGAVAAVVTGIGAIIGSVGTLVGNIISGVGQFVGGVLKGLGTAIFKGISFAASSLTGAVGNVGTFLSQNVFGSIAKSAFGNTLFQTAVKVGFSVATSKGLETLGVNPVIANLASAFVTGGITGAFNSGFSAANFIQNGVKALALQGTQTVLQNAGIDTTLSQTLLTIASPFIDGVQTGNIGGTTVNIIRDLPRNLSVYGVQSAGNALGFDPRLTAIGGSAILSSLNAGLATGLNSGTAIISSFSNALINTAVSVGFDAVMSAAQMPLPTRDFVRGLFESIQINGRSVGGIMLDLLHEGAKYLFSIPQDIYNSFRGAASEINTAVATGLNNFTQGLQSIMQAFSPQTREAIYAHETGLRSGSITRDGDLYRFVSQDAVIEYDAAEDVIIEKNLERFLKIEGLKSGTNGSIYYEKLTYQRLLEDNILLTENFDNGHLTDWNVSQGGTPILIVDLPGEEYSGRIDDFYQSGTVQFYGPIEVTDPDSAQAPSPDKYYIPFKVTLDTRNGQIVKSTAEVIQETAVDPRLDKKLYVLTNGVLNGNIKLEGAPDYLVNLKSDVVSRSLAPNRVVDSDVILAPTFFTSAILKLWGTLQNAATTAAASATVSGLVVKTVFDQVVGDIYDAAVAIPRDVFLWLLESSNAVRHSALSSEIKESVDAYFAAFGQNRRQRQTVAVGYSGGFVPMVEALTRQLYNSTLNTGYNVKTLVAIGAALVKPSAALNDLLLKMLEATDYLQRTNEVGHDLIQATLQNLDQLMLSNLNVSLGASAMTNIMRFVSEETPELARQEFERALEIIKPYLAPLFQGFILDDLTQTNTDMIVNMYGTNDILAKLAINGNTLGGYRSSLAGFNTTDPLHSLVNVEIVGATHFDYMKRSDTPSNLINVVTPEAKRWNEVVADFVADVTLNSGSFDELNVFLGAYGAAATKISDKWVIRLPGWEAHQ